CTNLGEALRSIGEGAVLFRTKGVAGTGNIVEAVRQLRKVNKDINYIKNDDKSELMAIAKNLQAPNDLVTYVHKNGR
ncbi:pyridoxal 5'-phosphate synthase lyase subunit PdxS, partial [Francisella tularensis subsp. holarctica]|nr:pyridoxal 5'-phosphate synthase lyase subunit PdxS [Francisella tularensis subsp. holarctica]